MVRAIFVVAVLCSVSASAVAEKQSFAAARAHYRSGASYYARGKYRDAVREFEQSYELSRKAEILYNLAQCHDKLGERPKVVYYLKRYLKEKPQAEDRDQVRAWLGNLEQALAAERAAAERAAAERAATEQRVATERAAAERAAAEKRAAEERAVAARAAAERAAAEKRAAEARAAQERARAERASAQHRQASQADHAVAARKSHADAQTRARARAAAEKEGSGWRWTGHISIGVGIVTLLCSVIPATMAYTKARDLEEALVPGAYFDGDLQDKYTSGKENEKQFIGLLVAGSAITVLGMTSLLYGNHLRRQAERRLTIMPTPGGASVAWRF